MKKYTNIINGKEFSFSGKTFECTSPFPIYDSFKFLVSDSNEMDIKIAASYAKNTGIKLNDLGYLKRKEIIKNAAKHLHFDEDDIDHCVMMMGMPKKYIKNYISEVPLLLSGYSDALEQRSNFLNAQISKIYQNVGYIEMKYPLNGFAYSIVPSNDPRALSFVFSVLGTLGIPALLKISKNELPIAQKIAKTVIAEGYPAGCLNLLSWDTADENKAKKLHFYILNEHGPSFFMPFGNDDTVDNQLRYETVSKINPDVLLENIDMLVNKDRKNLESLLREFTVTEKVDRLRGNVFRHTSGNCAMIVDGFSDERVHLSTISAFEYPISCKSAKSAYFVGSNRDFERYKIKLKENVEKLVIGDPLNENTDVGFVDKNVLEKVLNKVEELKHLNHLDIVYGGEKISDHQASPLILVTEDPESPFLTKENSVYILTLKRVDSLEQAIEECNIPRFKERLAVSVFSDREDIDIVGALTNLRCDQCHLNQITRFLHPPAHQGILYPERMSRTKSIFIGPEKISRIPLPTETIKKIYRVLIIDDDHKIADDMKEQMELEYSIDEEFNRRNKVSFLSNYSGEDGVETIRREHNIDVVVTDMRMDGIGGGETIRKIKEINPKIFPIVVTAYAENGDKNEARTAGVYESEYFQKPYESKELWKSIKRGLQKL